jgi:hypothetical protein
MAAAADTLLGCLMSGRGGASEVGTTGRRSLLLLVVERPRACGFLCERESER